MLGTRSIQLQIHGGAKMLILGTIELIYDGRGGVSKQSFLTKDDKFCGLKEKYGVKRR